MDENRHWVPSSPINLIFHLVEVRENANHEPSFHVTYYTLRLTTAKFIPRKNYLTEFTEKYLDNIRSLKLTSRNFWVEFQKKQQVNFRARFIFD